VRTGARAHGRGTEADAANSTIEEVLQTKDQLVERHLSLL
jgi:hypothetical protein